MITKYKIQDIAKDLEIKSPEIITLLGKYFEGVKRTRTSAPEPDELDMIFE